jgi:hypothetical protein
MRLVEDWQTHAHSTPPKPQGTGDPFRDGVLLAWLEAEWRGDAVLAHFAREGTALVLTDRDGTWRAYEVPLTVAPPGEASHRYFLSARVSTALEGAGIWTVADLRHPKVPWVHGVGPLGRSEISRLLGTGQEELL